MQNQLPGLIGVHQVMATLGYGDAIGHEALGIQRVLRHAGYESNIYVETADVRVESFTEDYHDLIEQSNPNNILIHHFSLGSKASRVAFALPDRMVLIYHNITPPSYFVGVNDDLVRQCYSGRRELTAYIPRCDLALGDSEFNRLELEQVGFPVTDVLPVVPSLKHLDVEPDNIMANEFDDDRTNILFVGRMIPNKRIDDLIKFFNVYRLRYNPRSRLLLVGAHSGFEEYVGALYNLIRTLRIPDVHLFGHVSNEELTALYNVSDLFLSASEHEGFCVPLVEAFYKQIPVMAYSSTAIPSTLDGGGVLYDRKDPRHVASIIHTVLSDTSLHDEIMIAQNAALARLRQKDFGSTLTSFIKQVHEGPRAAPPTVAPDFWEQFALDARRRARRYS